MLAVFRPEEVFVVVDGKSWAVALWSQDSHPYLWKMAGSHYSS